MPFAVRDQWFESPSGYIYRGFSFSLSHKHSGLASAGVYRYLIRPLNGKDVHLELYAVSSTSTPLLVELLEGPTISATGALQTARNRHRGKVNTPEALSVYAGASTSADGTLLEATRTVGDRRGGSVDFGERSEWVLKKQTDYLVKVTNESNQSANIVFNTFWHEAQ